MDAQGENLSYEWRYASGALWSSGPEPYMVRGTVSGGLQMSSDGECYYVIVSNAAGSVTSEQGCLTVVEIEGDYSRHSAWAHELASEYLSAPKVTARLLEEVGL